MRLFSVKNLMAILLLSVGLQAQFLTSVASNPASTTSSVTWVTCAQATSVVKYGTTTSYGKTTTVSGSTSAHSVQLTGLLPQTTYHFITVSVDSNGSSVQSADQVFTTLANPPPAPTINSKPANPTLATTATFTFSDTQTGVSFLCGLDGASPAACTSGVNYSGLAAGSHSFAVQAKNSSGQLSAAATYSWVVSRPHTVTLAWDASITDGVSYDVYRASNGGTFALLTSGVTGTTFVDSTVVNGQTYSYVGTAVNGNGESVLSNEVDLTVPAQ